MQAEFYLVGRYCAVTTFAADDGRTDDVVFLVAFVYSPFAFNISIIERCTFAFCYTFKCVVGKELIVYAYVVGNFYTNAVSVFTLVNTVTL